MRAVAALALAALAAPAAAQPLAIPFAPPIEKPLRYETVQTRDFEGRPQRFTMVQELRFTRTAEGYGLAIRLVDARSAADPRLAALFNAGMRPFLDVTIPLRVSADGRLLGVVDRDAVWAKIVAGLETVARSLRQDGGDAATVDALERYFAAFAASPPAAREAKLLENASELLGFGRPALAVGASMPYATSAPSPVGGAPIRVGGTLSLADADAGAAHYVVRTETNAADMARAADAMAAQLGAGGDAEWQGEFAAQIAAFKAQRLGERTDIRLSRGTGLILSATTVKTGRSGTAAPAVLAEETTRLLP